MSHPSWVRGLKQTRHSLAAKTKHVAPLVGAWIETVVISLALRAEMSHPSWVRGLKLEKTDKLSNTQRSHPSWVRGLKRSYGAADEIKTRVAPLVGAWIETYLVALRNTNP